MQVEEAKVSWSEKARSTKVDAKGVGSLSISPGGRCRNGGPCHNKWSLGVGHKLWLVAFGEGFEDGGRGGRSWERDEAATWVIRDE